MHRNACWITPDGFFVRPAISHIGSIIRCPESFGETAASIQATLTAQDDGESAAHEAKSQDDLLARVIRRGFICINRTTAPDCPHWSIQYFVLVPQMHAVLADWAALLWRNGREPASDVLLHCIRDNRLTKMNTYELAMPGFTVQQQCVVLSEEEFCHGSIRN